MTLQNTPRLIAIRYGYGGFREKHISYPVKQYRLAIKSFELGEISVYELTSARQKQHDTMQRYYSAIKEAYTSYFRLRSMALYDFKSGQNLEDIYLKNE